MTMNDELSEWIADVVKAAISAKGISKESISTKDVLSIVDKAALQILNQNLNQEKLFVGSLYAEALYPSLNKDKTAKLIGELIEEAGLKGGGSISGGPQYM